ncbi:MAG: hypothetical protein Q8R81_04405 [Novosphingobium sp.]|uniref:hypothetical protein n=1 Tax=Novosphingobium sp. TaxID=1874826 RepID=UPI0027336717|nr:hypothetical protein [Novosphingobium sp.]MDP3549620.1 hypothetical protein [Novosphingobium sp.]
MVLLAALLGGCVGPGLSRFEQVLAANDSATTALGQWCKAQAIATPPTIRALANRAAQAPASTEIRAALGVGAHEAVGYRHVQLVCGDTVMSVAHNWYVPGRLTPEMNRTLETSDTPFGKVVSPLGFRRERLSEQRGAMAECPQGTVLSHRAVLKLSDGRAISVVVECYTRANISRATN